MRFHGSTSFADLVSPNKEDHSSYINGLILFASILGSFFMLWASILLYLKYKGQNMGCAAGIPFHMKKQGPTDRLADSHPSTDVEDFESSSTGSKKNAEADHMALTSTIESLKATDDDKTTAWVNRRQRRTRIAFFCSGIVALLCTCMLVAYSFSPIRGTIAGSDELIKVSFCCPVSAHFKSMNVLSFVCRCFNSKESRAILDEIETTVIAVSSAIDSANATVSSASFEFNEICPNYNDTVDLGVDLEALTVFVTSETDKIQSGVAGNMTKINQTLASIRGTLDKVQEATETSEDYISVLPILLICLCIAITGALAATILAWTGRKTSKFQNRVAYGLLPLFLTISVFCWVAAIAAAIGTVVTAGKLDM